MPMFDIREPSVPALEAAPVYFRYGSNQSRVLVDLLTANAILVVYRALSPENQAKLERMLQQPSGLTRLTEFCFKHVSLKPA